MTHLITRILTTTALVSAVSFTAFAGDHKKNKMDANSDGLVQLEEFLSHKATKFAENDTNSDGRIDAAERKVCKENKRKKRANAKFTDADTDSNNVISKAEFMAANDKHHERKMTKMDINGDGVVDKAEKKQLRKQMKDRKKQMSAIQKDANKDGLISLTEQQAAATARFKQVDANSDGALNADELKMLKKGRKG